MENQNQDQSGEMENQNQKKGGNVKAKPSMGNMERNRNRKI